MTSPAHPSSSNVRQDLAFSPIEGEASRDSTVRDRGSPQQENNDFQGASLSSNRRNVLFQHVEPPSVSIQSDHQEEEVAEEEEGDEPAETESGPLVDEETPDKASFRDLFNCVCASFPEARIDQKSPDPPVGVGNFTHNILGRASTSQDPSLTFPEFRAVGNMWSQVEQRWPSLASASRSSFNLLPRRSAFYKTSDSFAAPVCNKDLERLFKSPVISRRQVPLSLDSCRRIQEQMLLQRDVSSFLGWMSQTLVQMVLDPNIDIRTSPLFLQVTKSLQLAAVFNMLKVVNRELVVSHLQCHVPRHLKEDHMASSLASRSLFDEEVVKRVMAETKEDTQMAANVKIAYHQTTQRSQPPQRQQQQRQPQQWQPQQYKRGGQSYKRGSSRGRPKIWKKKNWKGAQTKDKSGGSKSKTPTRGFRK